MSVIFNVCVRKWEEKACNVLSATLDRPIFPCKFEKVIYFYKHYVYNEYFKENAYFFNCSNNGDPETYSIIWQAKTKIITCEVITSLKRFF